MHTPPTKTTKRKMNHASFGCTKQNQAWVSHKHVCAFLTSRWSTCTGIPSRSGFPYGFSTDSWALGISRIRFWKEAINSYKPWRHGSYRISVYHHGGSGYFVPKVSCPAISIFLCGVNLEILEEIGTSSKNHSRILVFSGKKPGRIRRVPPF